VIQKANIPEFLALAKTCPVLDVRSPAEYNHAHIPGAYNLPLFSDEERKVVGTLYKQQGREQAIKDGLDYFGPKMRSIVESAEAIVATHPNAQQPNTVLVHCWRGGMRSAGIAWLLDLYGFKVYTLAGGYKSFRNWVLQQFEKPYNLNILGGNTGAGKTLVLKDLAKANHHIIDLEGLANHKGSAFGALGEEAQSTQEMFENKLAVQLSAIASQLPESEAIWVEDESRRIGSVNLPAAFWGNMQHSPLYFLDVPFEERLRYITAGYGVFKKEDLVNAIMRIQKRLGGLNTKNAINYLLENNYTEAFRILLSYYDKYYERDLEERRKINKRITTITCTDARTSCEKLLATKQLHHGITDTRI
jgi:tRNA 2-selenouridine synthase